MQKAKGEFSDVGEKEKYLTPEQARKLLNYKSIRTIYRKIKSGEIACLPTVKGAYRIPASQFKQS